MTVAPEPLDSRDRIAGLKKGLHIIEAFDAAHPRLSATEMGEHCGMTVFKSLADVAVLELLDNICKPRMISLQVEMRHVNQLMPVF
jgi:hypothetical protein